MKAIRDIAEVQAGDVLYHSAFGFARVQRTTPAGVALQWERGGENLPREVQPEALGRVYALCSPEGFFRRALDDAEGLRKSLFADPPDALALLLDDLPGPQAPHDLRDWVVGRGVMSAPAFDAWWRGAQQHITDDPRFELTMGRVGLRGRGEPVDVSLDNPLLSAERRIDVARGLRPKIGQHAYVDQIVIAMRTGGARARSKAIAALQDVDASYALARLAGPSAIELDALVYGLSHAPWSPADVALEVHDRLFARVLQPLEADHPLEGEDRLAAALIAWKAPDVAARMCRAAALHGRGPLLVEAALGKLPPAMAESVALDMLRAASGDPHTVAFLADRLIAVARTSGADLAAELEREDRRALAVAVRRATDRRTGRRPLQPASGEVVRPVEPEGKPLADLASGDDPTLPALGLELARAIAQHHANKRLAYPTLAAIQLHPSGRVALQPANEAPKLPTTERYSTATDIFAGALALVERAIGRRWENVQPDRVLPYLRHAAPDLPPSTLAPLDAALDPDPRRRPDAYQWMQRWEAVVAAESARAAAEPRASVRLRVGFDTHIGRLKILQSQTNQDAVYVSSKGSYSLLAVCDGISTATAGSGDLAAAVTAQVLASLWNQALPRIVEATQAEIDRFADRALDTANRAVCEAAIRVAGGSMDGKVPMGTTAVVAIARGNQVSLAWLGDSRAYLVGPYGAALLTADQNQAGNRLREWRAGTRPQWDPAGYALVGYVGHFDEDMTPRVLPASHTTFTLLPGERLVLCSDGITDFLGTTHPEVSAALCALALEGDDLEEIARSLVGAANRGGGGDNATAVVAALSD